MTAGVPDITAYVFEALGSIKAQLSGLTAMAETQARLARENDEETADKLDALQREFGTMQVKVAEIERNYASLRASMNVLEPKVETLVTQRNRVLSVVAAVAAAGSAAWWVFGGAVVELAKATWKAIRV